MVIASAGAETVLFAVSTLVGVAGALGVAYTVFRSASEQRLREVDQHIITNQNVLMSQLEAQLAEARKDAAKEKDRADTYRSDLTQRAAVEHLSDHVIREEQIRREEHSAILMLLKDMIAQLKNSRGHIQ